MIFTALLFFLQSYVSPNKTCRLVSMLSARDRPRGYALFFWFLWESQYARDRQHGIQYLWLSYIFISFNLQITLRVCKQAEIIPQENKKQTYLRSIRKVGLSFLKFFTCDQMIDEYIIMLQHCNQKRLCIMLRCFWLQFKLYFKANFSFKWLIVIL